MERYALQSDITAYLKEREEAIKTGDRERAWKAWDLLVYKSWLEEPRPTSTPLPVNTARPAALKIKRVA